MALKRQLRDGGDADFHLNQRRHLLSNILKGVSRPARMEEALPLLEPIIRKWVREEVERAFLTFERSLDTETLRSETGSRSLWLQFESNLPATLFTGNKIVSDINRCIKIRLYDPGTQQTVTSGPFSSMKVGVVVVEGGEFEGEEFKSKLVQSREGKRPLLTGEVVVSLKNGEGCINELCFTDNSSWIRSGKFRLGLTGCDVREGISNAFKVKDQRGESYQKLYPPNLGSEVWRLNKIAKGGTYHQQLSELGVATVGDLLRWHAMNQIALRAALQKISDKKWETIIAHASTCILDDKKYMYRDGGAALVFDSIYRVIGATFDGQTCHPAHTLDMRRVEEMKQRAYANLNKWEIFEGEVQGQQMNKHESNSSFEIGESSGFNLTFSSSFGVNDYMEFEVELSETFTFFLFSVNHDLLQYLLIMESLIPRITSTNQSGASKLSRGGNNYETM